MAMSEPKKLREKDVAEIRKHVEACRAYVLKGSENAFPDGPEDTLAILADAEKLLADRDAYVADLKEARRLVSMVRCDMECPADGHWEDCAKHQADAFLERTK